MLIIGERINSSRKGIFEAIRDGNTPFIQAEARMQDESGADYIDVNLGGTMEKQLVIVRFCSLQFVNDQPII